MAQRYADTVRAPEFPPGVDWLNFGGKAGSHLLTLLRALRMPIVSTLHTVLGEPSDGQRRVMEELTKLSERLVVMSEPGAALLRDRYGVPASKIDLIPHGSPRRVSVARA